MQLGLDPDLWARIHRHLNDPRERAAFLFVQLTGSESWEPVDEWFLDPSTDYDDSSEEHVALAPHVMPQVFKRAHDAKAAVVEMHGHYWPGLRTRFSPYDIVGLRELVPQMLWRLPGRPYFALVMGAESFDGLVWIDRDQAQTVSPLRVGTDELVPTGASLEVWERCL